MKKFKTLAKTLLTISSLFLFIGCQQNSSPATPATPETQTNSTDSTSKEVAIQNMAFDQKDITISIGTKVKWTNNDSVPHTATSNTGIFASDNLKKGQSFEFTFDKEGSYPYYCAIHPAMKGTITVIKAAKFPL